ncbi:hypothetical protein [Enterococcus mundtii]|uniref:hypothetical protein n=1 Tax=Enterococcus mundtii TaxID=53346 RepID=UPI001377ABFF|nr:hypothetical protein [Enterococcus mundtii]NBA62794.1 hypothetical protein [Enterococcus mundtii]
MTKIFEFFKTPQNIKETMTIFEFKQEYADINYQMVCDIKSELDGKIINRDKPTIIFYETAYEDNQLFIEDIENEDDLTLFTGKVTLHLKVNKKVSNGYLSIYSLDTFEKFLIDRNFIELVRILSKYIFDEGVEKFSVLDEPDVTVFSSDTFEISGEKVPKKINENVERYKILNRFHDIGQLIDFNDIKFIPEDFENQLDNIEHMELINKIEECKIFFSIAFLLNSTSFIDDFKFQIELKSKERHKELIKYNSLLSDKYNKSYDIYRWVYSETIVDKVQIVRYFMLESPNDVILLNTDVYKSALFSYTQFINKELDKFISAQDKALVAIQENQKKFKDLRSNVVSIFKANSFTMLGFFISNYLVKQINNNNPSATELLRISGLTICGIFGIYLLLTVLQTFIETKRLKKDYETLRTLLAENLVEKYVFKYLPDEVIDDEVKYIFRYSIVVFFIWTIELVLMMCFIVKLV